jgi:hypothetical protein
MIGSDCSSGPGAAWTLRHAVQWSYDLLGADEKALLSRCSVFAGGFDLAAACAVMDTDDELATLDLLDALVRKSLLVADRSASQTRFSMLETIRQFAEEQLVQTGEADGRRTMHAHHFGGRETDALAIWDSPRQREAYDWLALELPNLRAAFRWAADGGDLDTAAAIATYAGFLGFWVEQLEPVAWAEETIEPARAANHRRLPQLYAIATQCYATGRLDDSLRYAESGRAAIDSGHFDPVPYDFETWLGGPYMWTGVPDQWLELCRHTITQGRGGRYFAQANLVVALTFNGCAEDALAASERLVAGAEETENPIAICYALLAHGYARRSTDPTATYEDFYRGLTIAQATGNRQVESHLAGNLSWIAAARGQTFVAFDYLTLEIRNHYDSGSFSLMLSPLLILCVVLHGLGHTEPAATISGFANTPFTYVSFGEMNDLVTHLREALGNDAYDAIARVGDRMTPAAMATYALDQIDLARAELDSTQQLPKPPNP